MFTYNTKGTCSRQIIFDVDGENKIHNVKFIGGCSGNLQGISNSWKERVSTRSKLLSAALNAGRIRPVPTNSRRRSACTKREPFAKKAKKWDFN